VVNGGMTFRFATVADCRFLGELNYQLIRDEGHRNKMTAVELARRMEEWLSKEYRAVIFEDAGAVIGYVLFRDGEDEIYLRQLFICRGLRRRGFGRSAVQILREQIWPRDRRLTVEVLVANTSAVEFWRAMGYRDYALTLEIVTGRFGS
jgi:ribosomal protein S18 acetylase RimI-like enzyme